jgi:hypothetical protein
MFIKRGLERRLRGTPQKGPQFVNIWLTVCCCRMYVGTAEDVANRC